MFYVQLKAAIGNIQTARTAAGQRIVSFVMGHAKNHTKHTLYTLFSCVCKDAVWLYEALRWAFTANINISSAQPTRHTRYIFARRYFVVTRSRHVFFFFFILFCSLASTTFNDYKHTLYGLTLPRTLNRSALIAARLQSSDNKHIQNTLCIASSADQVFCVFYPRANRDDRTRVT